MAVNAARQAVRIDDDAGLLGHRELHRQHLAVQSDAAHRQRLSIRVVKADAAEIDREVILERAHDDLENAPQILPLTDGARDLVEQTETSQLLLECSPPISFAAQFRIPDLRRPGPDPGFCFALFCPVPHWHR